MAAKQWIMVRIDPSTHRELCRVREEMETADAMKLIELERDNRDRVSLDQVIRRLIQMRDKHAERRQRSNAKRRTVKAATPVPQSLENDTTAGSSTAN